MFSCMVCDHNEYKEYLSNCSDYYLNTLFKVDYVKCLNCGLVQQNPIPKDISKFYQNYPIHQTKSNVNEFIKYHLLRQVYMTAPTLKSDTILDFGCGDGSYLKRIKQNKINCVGFEYDEKNSIQIESNIGVKIYSSLIELGVELKNKIDCITVHFVLEHLTNLQSTFNIFSKLLKPNGLLYVVVPNIFSWEANFFAKKWHGLDPPRHISFPNINHLNILARKNHMKLITYRSAFFPNTLSGSISNFVFNNFNKFLFLGILPLSSILSGFFPNGTLVCEIRKNS